MAKYIKSSQGEMILYDTAGAAKQSLADKGMAGYAIVDQPDSMGNTQQWAQTGLSGVPQTQPEIAPSVSTPASPDPAAVAPPSNQQVAPEATATPDTTHYFEGDQTGQTIEDPTRPGTTYSPTAALASGSRGKGESIGTGAASGAAAGTSVMPGWGTAIGAGIGAIGGAMEQGPEETELQKSQGRIANVQADQAEMSQASGEKEALPVRTKMPILSGLPSGPLRVPQRAAWAMQYGLGETAKKPTPENLDYLRSHPDTPMSVAASKYARLQAQENRLRIAKLIIYPLALGAMLV